MYNSYVNSLRILKFWPLESLLSGRIHQRLAPANVITLGSLPTNCYPFWGSHTILPWLNSLLHSGQGAYCWVVALRVQEQMKNLTKKHHHGQTSVCETAFSL